MTTNPHHLEVWQALANPDPAVPAYEGVYAVSPQVQQGHPARDMDGYPEFPYLEFNKPGQGCLYFIGIYANDQVDLELQVAAVKEALNGE